MGTKVPMHFTVSLMVDPEDKIINVKEELRAVLVTRMYHYSPFMWSHRTDFIDVQRFHRKFDVPIASQPSLLSGEALTFRSKFLDEELQEFKDDTEVGNLLGAGDALVDLCYVALGTADMMGLPWQRMWDEVQTKNMQKERAVSADQSKRGSKLDVIKPAGWTPPDHSQFVGIGPWPVFTGE